MAQTPRNNSQPDWYAILQLPPNADAAAIKAAHRSRAREVHPDVNAAADANARMAELNRARDVLLDPAARAAYDRARGLANMATAGMRRGRPQGNAGTAGSGRMRFTFDTEDPLRSGPRSEPEYTGSPRPGEAARWRFDARGGLGQEDWYAFLGVHPWSTEDEVSKAIQGLVGQSIATYLGPEERVDRQAKLRMAWEALGNHRKRMEYDRTRPPWQPRPGLQTDWYAFLGVRRRAEAEEIGEAVTRVSHEIGDRAWNAELRERQAKLREAWWILRDATRRAAYDAALGPKGTAS